MDIATFWKIIDAANAASGGDMDKKCAALERALSLLPTEEIGSFEDCLDRLMDDAYRWDLWAAAYIIGGGCSDDCFMDFRSTLISLGQRVYEAALKDPESLADLSLTPEQATYEGFAYVAMELYKTRSGKLHTRIGASPRSPSGTDWAEEDLPKLLPRLWKKYGDST